MDAACDGGGADPADIVAHRLADRARPSDYDTFILWLRTPFTTVLMVLLLIALFYHMALGLQVVVEDYVHTDRIKMPDCGCDPPRMFCTGRRRHHRHITHCLGG